MLGNVPGFLYEFHRKRQFSGAIVRAFTGSFTLKVTYKLTCYPIYLPTALVALKAITFPQFTVTI
jgi:hypothetical protein